LWWRWVEGQLREYNCAELIREDIYNEIRLIQDDDYIRIPTSNVDGMPRTFGFHSQVEGQAERREVAAAKWRNKLSKLNRQVKRVEAALKHLNDTERQIIVNTYFTLLSEHDVADTAGTSIQKCRQIRKRAMIKLYRIFKGEWPPDVEPIFINRKLEPVEVAPLS